MSRLIPVCVFAVTAVCCIGAIAKAAPVLDQVIPPLQFSAAFFSDVEVAQTFEVGIAGQLAAVDLYLNDPFHQTPSGTTVRITRLDSAGAPSLLTGDTLSTAILPVGSVPHPVDFVRVDFPTPLLNVAVGDKLAIVMHTPTASGNLSWNGTFEDVYPRGASFARFHLQGGAWMPSIIELSMRTYVDPVPEPSTFAASLIAGASFLVLRRSRPNR